MKYYVARDKNGELCLYHNEPYRDYDFEEWLGYHLCVDIDPSLFPDLKWEDEPIEVELTLKEVGK